MFLNKQHEEAYGYLQAQNYSVAVEKYSACISLAPTAPELYSERGVCYIHLKEEKKSLADFDKSVELQPDYAYRYASRGHARDFFGDIDGAIDDYELAAELDPKDAIVYNNLGLLLEKKGNIEMAKRHYERSDKLRKAEDELYNLVDELEGKLPEEKTFTQPAATTIEENIAQEEKITPSTQGEMKKIFTQKSQFREFLAFVKNGFRLKK